MAVKPAGPEAVLSSALSPTCFKPLISAWLSHDELLVSDWLCCTVQFQLD